MALFCEEKVTDFFWSAGVYVWEDVFFSFVRLHQLPDAKQLLPVVVRRYFERDTQSSDLFDRTVCV